MSWALLVLWLAGAGGIIFAARDMMNVEARYRTGAAIAAGVLWPIWAIVLAAFLLADLIEWLVRLAVEDGDAA